MRKISKEEVGNLTFVFRAKRACSSLPLLRVLLKELSMIGSMVLVEENDWKPYFTSVKNCRRTIHIRTKHRKSPFDIYPIRVITHLSEEGMVVERIA